MHSRDTHAGLRLGFGTERQSLLTLATVSLLLTMVLTAPALALALLG